MPSGGRTRSRRARAANMSSASTTRASLERFFCAMPNCARQRNSSPVTIPCLRVTAETLAPGSSVSPELDLRRLRRRRSPRRRHLHADPDRQAQQRRPASLACRRPCQAARSSGQQARRSAALELASRQNIGSRLIEPVSAQAKKPSACGLHRMRTPFLALPGRARGAIPSHISRG